MQLHTGCHSYITYNQSHQNCKCTNCCRPTMSLSHTMIWRWKSILHLSSWTCFYKCAHFTTIAYNQRKKVWLTYGTGLWKNHVSASRQTVVKYIMRMVSERFYRAKKNLHSELLKRTSSCCDSWKFQSAVFTWYWSADIIRCKSSCWVCSRKLSSLPGASGHASQTLCIRWRCFTLTAAAGGPGYCTPVLSFQYFIAIRYDRSLT